MNLVAGIVIVCSIPVFVSIDLDSLEKAQTEQY